MITQAEVRHMADFIFCQADDSNKFKTMVAFDCRGLEPVDFSPRVGGCFMVITIT